MRVVNGLPVLNASSLPCDEEPPVQFVRAGLGQNLDAPVAQVVEFGGKGILVDANLANRRLGRQLAAGESIDINLPAVRPGRRAGQRRQFVGQLVGIVRERIQILALEDDASWSCRWPRCSPWALSSVTITLCCATAMAIEMSTCFDLPGRELEWLGDAKGQSPHSWLALCSRRAPGRSPHRRLPHPRLRRGYGLPPRWRW